MRGDTTCPHHLVCRKGKCLTSCNDDLDCTDGLRCDWATGRCVSEFACDCANLNDCSGHGICTETCTCLCDEGWSGSACSDQPLGLRRLHDLRNLPDPPREGFTWSRRPQTGRSGSASVETSASSRWRSVRAQVRCCSALVEAERRRPRCACRSRRSGNAPTAPRGGSRRHPPLGLGGIAVLALGDTDLATASTVGGLADEVEADRRRDSPGCWCTIAGPRSWWEAPQKLLPSTA